MIVLILGAPDSGKSRRAEDCAVRVAEGGAPIYLATMIPMDAEGRRRVEKHRRQRAGKGFETVERPRDLVGWLRERRDLAERVCLLECAANLVGNEMRAAANARLSDSELARLVVESIVALGAATRALVVVSDEFELDAPGYDDETRRYVAILRETNEALRKIADRVDERSNEGWTIRENR